MTLYWNIDDQTVARKPGAPIRTRSRRVAKNTELSESGNLEVKRDWRFWCIILSLAICILLSAIEFVRILDHSTVFFAKQFRVFLSPPELRRNRTPGHH
jgi:hypothetical protein